MEWLQSIIGPLLGALFGGGIVALLLNRYFKRVDDTTQQRRELGQAYLSDSQLTNQRLMELWSQSVTNEQALRRELNAAEHECRQNKSAYYELIAHHQRVENDNDDLTEEVAKLKKKLQEQDVALQKALAENAALKEAIETQKGK